MNLDESHDNMNTTTKTHLVNFEKTTEILKKSVGPDKIQT